MDHRFSRVIDRIFNDSLPNRQARWSVDRNGVILGKEGIKILKNSGTFVIPIVQKAHKLSLLTHKLEIGTPEVYTEQGTDQSKCDGFS